MAMMIAPTAFAGNSPALYVSPASEAADQKGDNNAIGLFNRSEANKRLKKVHGVVLEVSSTMIKVDAAHDKDNHVAVDPDKIYTFNIDDTTKVIRRFRGTGSVSEISVGDSVRIWATRVNDGLGTAKLIWDKSIWWLRLGGKVSELNTTEQTFKLLMPRRTKLGGLKTMSANVTTDATTQYFKSDGTVGDFTMLANESKVRLRGVWNNVDKVVQAKKIWLIE